MPIYYKTIVNIKFNKFINLDGELVSERTESVTATGNTVEESKNAALSQAALILTNDKKEKAVFELKTLKIKSKRIF